MYTWKNRRDAVKSRAALLLFTLTAALTVSGCGSTATTEQAEYTPEQTDRRVVNAYNEFGLGLYGKLAQTEKDGNLFLSPSSIAFALSMAYNGADGTTRDEMSRTMRLPDITLEELNKANLILRDVLTHADPRVQLSAANSLWGRKGWTFDKDFIQRIKAYYGAKASVLDFADPGAADKMNKWVKQETKGKIDGIVQGPIDGDAVLFLLNAVYFKGEWTTPFKKEATREKPFRLPDGKTKNHPMMAQTGTFEYTKGDGYQAVRLSYGEGYVGMIVVLPDPDIGLQKLNERWTGEAWGRMLSGLKAQSGEVVLPKFKLEYSATLNDALKALGMGTAFDRHKADFHHMLPAPPTTYIGEVKHKTYVQIDEKGTEAAAATKVEMRAGSAAPSSAAFRMEVDRPFLFAIQERRTGAILFIGSVSDPREP